ANASSAGCVLFRLRRGSIALAQAFSRGPLDGMENQSGDDRHLLSAERSGIERSINKNPVAATKLLRRPQESESCDLLALRERRESYSCALGFFLRFANALFESAHGEVGLLFVDEKRWRQPNGVIAGAKDAQALVESEVDDGIAQVRGFFLRALIANNFNADHQ